MMYTRSFVLLFVVNLLLMAVMAQVKSGDCPPPTAIGVCRYTCDKDSQCSGREKCCPTSCGGTTCIMPVTMRRPATGEKRGSCPSRPSGPWVCSSTCVFDSDCRSSLKCCKNRCGAMACLKPEA